MFSCEFCEISKSTFLREHLWTTASESKRKYIKLSLIVQFGFVITPQQSLQKCMLLKSDLALHKCSVEKVCRFFGKVAGQFATIFNYTEQETSLKYIHTFWHKWYQFN